MRVRGQLAELRAGGAVYQTYATTWRGVEFLMNYYPILDRVPKGSPGSSELTSRSYRWLAPPRWRNWTKAWLRWTSS
jgi:predicted dithiol-disulfide oxidoreductase (DUF899 family)